MSGSTNGTLAALAEETRLAALEAVVFRLFEELQTLRAELAASQLLLSSDEIRYWKRRNLATEYLLNAVRDRDWEKAHEIGHDLDYLRPDGEASAQFHHRPGK